MSFLIQVLFLILTTGIAYSALVELIRWQKTSLKRLAWCGVLPIYILFLIPSVVTLFVNKPNFILTAVQTSALVLLIIVSAIYGVILLHLKSRKGGVKLV